MTYPPPFLPPGETRQKLRRWKLLLLAALLVALAAGSVAILAQHASHTTPRVVPSSPTSPAPRSAPSPAPAPAPTSTLSSTPQRTLAKSSSAPSTSAKPAPTPDFLTPPPTSIHRSMTASPTTNTKPTVRSTTPPVLRGSNTPSPTPPATTFGPPPALAVTGHGNALHTFFTGFNFVVTWTASCATFTVSVDGTVLDGPGIAVLHSKGHHTLRIVSDCSWTVRVAA